MKDTLTPKLLDLLRRFEQQSIGFSTMMGEAEKPVPPKKPLPKPEPKKADPKAEKPDFKKEKNPSTKEPKKPQPEAPPPREIDMDDIPKTESQQPNQCMECGRIFSEAGKCPGCGSSSIGKFKKTEATVLNPEFTQQQAHGVDSGSYGTIPEEDASSVGGNSPDEEKDGPGHLLTFDDLRLRAKEGRMDNLTARLTEASKAEKTAYKAERLARLRQNAAILKTGVCPRCGTKLVRNNSMTGWWQCGHVGSPGFQAIPGPPCDFQFFYDPSAEEAKALMGESVTEASRFVGPFFIGGQEFASFGAAEEAAKEKARNFATPGSPSRASVIVSDSTGKVVAEYRAESNGMMNVRRYRESLNEAATCQCHYYDCPHEKAGHSCENPAEAAVMSAEDGDAIHCCRACRAEMLKDDFFFEDKRDLFGEIVEGFAGLARSGEYTLRLSRRTPSSQWEYFLSHPSGGGSGGNLSRYDGVENVVASIMNPSRISSSWMPPGSAYRLVVIVGGVVKKDEQRFL